MYGRRSTPHALCAVACNWRRAGGAEKGPQHLEEQESTAPPQIALWVYMECDVGGESLAQHPGLCGAALRAHVGG